MCAEAEFRNIAFRNRFTQGAQRLFDIFDKAFDHRIHECTVANRQKILDLIFVDGRSSAWSISNDGCDFMQWIDWQCLLN